MLASDPRDQSSAQSPSASPDVFKVLVAEDDDTALGNQQREIILLMLVQFRELQPADLGSHDGRELVHLETRVFFRQQQVAVSLSAAKLRSLNSNGCRWGGDLVSSSRTGR